jgi:4'-phosphopantetheinyl transferase
MMTTVCCHPPTAVHWQPGTACPFAHFPAVFRLALPPDNTPTARLDAGLTTDERDRADRYRQPADRLRFAGGRALLRFVAGQYAGQPANRIVVEIGPGGKPFLPGAPGLHLNLAHAGSWVLLAVGREPVGVDVEYINEAFDYQLVMESAFSPAEQHALTNSPRPRPLFYALWTRKEAFVKATGAGLTEAFAGIPALPGRHQIPLAGQDHDAAWTLRSFDVDDRHVAALAHRAGPGHPFFYDLTALLLPLSTHGCPTTHD